MKHDFQNISRKRRFIAVLCILSSLALFGLSAYECLPEWKSGYLNAELRKQVVLDSEKEVSEAGTGDVNLARKIDFDSLKKINPDIIGWIYIPETQIDYPVLKGADLSYYLSHTYDGSSSKVGSIFTRPDTKGDLKDQHIFLFGHRLASGRMFGQLYHYEAQDFAAGHPIYLYTPKESRKYMAYAAYQCIKSDETYIPVNAGNAENYLELVKTKALYFENRVLEDAGQRRFLTLSTCPARNSSQNRFVVQCIKIDTWRETSCVY